MAMTKMDFERDLEIDTVFADVKALNKKAALSYIAAHVANTFKIPLSSVLDSLIVQEARASSGMGGGVAIPVLTLKSARTPYTLLMRLSRPIDFDAVDAQPVSIICLVISPENSGVYHLRRLSRLTRLLKNEALIEKICGTDDEDTIRALIHSPDGWMLAA